MQNLKTSSPAVLALGTSVPTHLFSQDEILNHLAALGFEQDRRVRMIFGRAGISWRHFVIDDEFYVEPKSTQARNERYMQEALPLGETAICRCLDQAGVAPEQLTDFIVVSCTGLDIPGLDLRLAGHLGMSSALRRTNILAMGCYGAFPALLRACEAAAQTHPQRLVLVLALELCSLHFQLEASLDNIISTALFADGAAAILLGSREEEHQQHYALPHIVASTTFCNYQTLDHMAFHLTDHGFQMRLSAYVPDLLAAHVENFVDHFLESNALSRGDVRIWGIHPGSRKILDFVQSRLGLSDAQM
jgi:predicted naringenin-chalcone synthase